MKAADFQNTVKRSGDRLQGSAIRLIDDGQSVVNAKLNEATDIIQGAFAHLLDESQDLIRAKMAEASHVLQHSRELAADGVRRALDQAKDRAEDSYVEWDKAARRRPLAMAAVAIALGLGLGLALSRRRSASNSADKDSSVVGPERAPARVKTATRRAPASRKPPSGRKPPPSEPTVAH